MAEHTENDMHIAQMHMHNVCDMCFPIYRLGFNATVGQEIVA